MMRIPAVPPPPLLARVLLARVTLARVLLAGVLLALPLQAAAACLGAVAARPAPFRLQPASLRLAAAPPDSVRVTFIGHASFLLESPGGITAVTDYNDYLPPPLTPDIATMNHAHSTHYSDRPDPGIRYVLRGWPAEGRPAQWNLQVGDVHVRNVPTNIRGHGDATEYDGNSIFIFEVAGLCVAHLGHLHHRLTPGHIADIGRIDVLFVPVDGGYTLNIAEMSEVIGQIAAPLVIPMHYFSDTTLERFLARMRDSHEIRLNDSGSTLIARAALPRKPTILVLPGPS
jgi:L-ascorbate metabolism protein UlaG (beta-lactamase superfamily)